MKNRDNYRNYRNDYIKRLSFGEDFSAKKKVSLFKRHVSIWINSILDQNKSLSKEDFPFLKMRDYERGIFRDILNISKEENNLKNERTNIDVLYNMNEFKLNLYGLLNQINAEKLTAEKLFILLVNEFGTYLDSIGLNINKSIQSQQKIWDKIGEFELQKIKKISKILYSYFLKSWNSYLGRKFLSFLWDKNEAKKVLSKRRLYFPNWMDYRDADIYELILNYASKSEKRIATEQYIRQYGMGYPFFDSMPYFKTKIDKINSQLEKYCKKYNIPFKQLLNAESLNMAVETLRNNYDLTIWILGSGTGVAALHEMFGRNVGYMEWHKKWKKEAVWRKIWENEWKINSKNPKKILVCEHDTSTWATLTQLKERFEKLYPESIVDICFLYDFWKNADFVDNVWFFRKCINPREIVQVYFFDNIEILYKMVNSKEFKAKL
ncbi:MAG: hypothetical protein ACD_49C00079G0004 [uncultured bacterium (gcode 4)]|uniref:Uncharacterized protein n=1 Tax=uncultured bacterium (gcode 4) TaxID=1234023 RepID=K2ACV6_9BACT|nr:MAG: hypothetical protein ACD_49C00079G0004 [uncultured bacterium (gcode 4)]